ncbi:MAG: PAS domain-containing protein [Actinobacteria bacterium]|nr:PAS domain-containing protein [Actinomycetota bacterium]
MSFVRILNPRRDVKITVMAVLLAVALFLIFYSHAVNIETVYTHSLYIPIVIVAIWWKRKGVCVAVFLAIAVVLAHVFVSPGMPIADDVARAVSFVVIALVVALLCEKIETLLEERWERSLASVSEGVYLIDKEFTIKQCNRAFALLVGEKREDIVGRKCFEVVHGTGRPLETCVATAAAQDGSGMSMDIFEPFLGKHLELSANPIVETGEGGGVIPIVLSAWRGTSPSAKRPRRSSRGSTPS